MNAGWRLLAIMGIPVFSVFGFMFVSAGKHPETLLESPYVLVVLSAIPITLGIVVLLQRALAMTGSASGWLVVLSIVLALAAIATLSAKLSATRGPMSDAIAVLALFYSLTGLCGGGVLAIAERRGNWLIASGISAVLLIVGFFVALSNAKHWGNF